jgi:hypothetical protein
MAEHLHEKRKRDRKHARQPEGPTGRTKKAARGNDPEWLD